MIKKIAWEAFKNTGDINTYLEFKQIEEIEKGIATETETQSFNTINKKYGDNLNKEKGEITKWQT